MADGHPAATDEDAATWVLHAPAATGGPSWDLAGVALHTVIDVVVRHRAMDGARVEAVVGGGTRFDEPPVAAQLGCATARHTSADPRDPGYTDSVWWAIAQLWEAGLLAECRGATPCDDCGDRDAAATPPSGGDAQTALPAVVRFPVASDGALRTAGASLLVTVDGPAVLRDVATVAAPDGADLVLAHAADDDYPVVVDRAAIGDLLGSGATILRAVDAAEVRGARCRHPLDEADDAATEAGSARAGVAVLATAETSDDLPALTTAADLSARAAAAQPADGARDDDAPGGDAYAAIADRGLLFRRLPPPRTAEPCPTCAAAASGRRDRWVVTTTRWRAQLREQHDGVTRSAGTAPPWATGAEDWTVTTDDGGDVALPLWRCTACEHVTAVAGRAQLAALTHSDVAVADPRDAAVTSAAVPCGRCGDAAHRIPRWIDAAFVAGCLPFARFGFPAVDGSDARFARRWHADLVVDGRDHDADAALVVATLLWGARPHDAVLALPAAVDADIDATGLWQRWGADALRWAVVAGAGGGWGERTRAAHDGIITPLRDSCTAVVTAARAAGLPTTDAVRAPRAPRDQWDRWLLAELAATVDDARRHLDAYAPDRAAGRIGDVITALGTWQARRGAVLDDDVAALATLHEVLVTVAGLLAPFLPHLADELYEALVRADDPATPDSIHLLRYPTADPAARDDGLRHRMRAQGADPGAAPGPTPGDPRVRRRWEDPDAAPTALRPTGTR